MRTHSLWLVTTLLTLAPSLAGATAQVPERLIYKGKTVWLFSQPLERYFSQGHATYWDEPAWGPGSGRRPKAFRATSTACWRGYEGTWKIDAGHLWLASLHECHRGKEIALSEVFAGQKGPRKATWFTGILRVPLGKRLQDVHLGYDSQFEKDLFLAIREGKVEVERTVDNRDPKAAERGHGLREQPSQDELARGLMTSREGLARCARAGKQQGPVEVEILADGSVATIKLGGALPGTRVGRCLFGALAAARYPSFFGPAVRTKYQLP